MHVYVHHVNYEKKNAIYGAFPRSFVQFIYMIRKAVLTTSRVYQFSKLKKYLMLYWLISL